MDKIFISYRREDSEGFARSLFQSLVGYFGKNHVFMDVEAIGLGMDFVEAIDSSLADCGALLVLIGKDWVDCTDASGRRRLDIADDFVRTEVAKAIERNVRVIPVLVKGAPMPKAEDLPEALQLLVRRQALELRHERWNQDVEHLAASLAKALNLTRIDKVGPDPVTPPPAAPETAPIKPRRSKMVKLAGACAAAVVLLIVFAFLGTMKPDAPPVVVAPSPTPVAEPAPQPAPVARPAPQPAPLPTPAPAPSPEPQRVTSITGIWIDDDGARVEILQTGNMAVSQAVDPATGVLIRANWQLSGRTVEFEWAAASGNQGYGNGRISSDYNTIQYQAMDIVTGMQDTGRLTRATR